MGVGLEGGTVDMGGGDRSDSGHPVFLPVLFAFQL